MSNKKEFKKNYNKLIDELQIKLVHMQDWVIENDKKVVIIFEGRDAAGKGGTIKRITENLNELTTVLNRLVEKLDEDRSVKDHLITISSILKNLGEQNTDKISEFQSNLTLELRAITKQLSEIENSTNRLNNK